MTTPYLGEIKLFAGNFAILGYAFCQGQLLSIAQNNALYALIGTTYGGDGQTTFGLPDLQSRTPLHQGQGAGMTNRVIGEAGGAESVTLLTANMPGHTHQTIALTGDATLMVPTNALPARPSAATTEFLYLDPISAGNTNVSPSPQAIGNAGGNQPHNNIMPVLALNYLIAVQGIFPSPN